MLEEEGDVGPREHALGKTLLESVVELSLLDEPIQLRLANPLSGMIGEGQRKDIIWALYQLAALGSESFKEFLIVNVEQEETARLQGLVDIFEHLHEV